MKSSTGGGTTPCTKAFWGQIFWKTPLILRTWGVVVDTRLSMSQHCALVSKVAYDIPVCVTQNTACGYQSAVEATPRVLYPVLRLVPETQTRWTETNEGAQRWLGDRIMSSMGKGWDSWNCLAQFRESFIRIYKYLKERCSKEGTCFLQQCPATGPRGI